MEVIELIEEMCDICENLRQKGHRIRFVPTMGALHGGHGSLIRRANNDKDADYNYNKNNHISSSTSFLPLETSANNNDKEQQPNTCPRNTSCELSYNHSQTRIMNSQTRFSTAEEKNIDYFHDDNYDVKNVLKHKQKEKIIVIVSIFVNPKQFNNPDDFVNYPKNLETDLEICRNLNVDYVFTPTSGQMYPTKMNQLIKGYSVKNTLNHCIIQPPSNRLALDLEGKSRPGHFEGMLTVVCKLFNIIKPHVAYFGEKDYQQLIMVQNMVHDLNMNIQIRAGQTIRDANSLPLSSRNVRLKENERKVASAMYNILCDAKDAIESKQITSSSYDIVGDLNDLDINDNSIGYKDLDTTIFASMLTTLSLNLSDDWLDLIKVDYLELRCAKDITQISYVESCDFEGFDCENGCVKSRLNPAGANVPRPILKARLLISVTICEVRLLDNIEILLNLDKR